MEIMLTNQQIFDKALAGVRTQGVKSKPGPDSGGCCYRGVGAAGAQLCCGVGHLIPDNAYLERFDSQDEPDLRVGTMLKDLEFSKALISGGVEVSREEVKRLLAGLQVAHDCASDFPAHFLRSFNAGMESLALREGLSYTEPK